MRTATAARLFLLAVFTAAFALYWLCSCSRAAWYAPLALPADSLLVPVLPRKLKAAGTVTIIYQTGQGNVATPTVAGKTKADAAAVGPAADATASTTRAGPPWWVYALLLVAGAMGWGRLKKTFGLL